MTNSPFICIICIMVYYIMYLNDEIQLLWGTLEKKNLSFA